MSGYLIVCPAKFQFPMGISRSCYVAATAPMPDAARGFNSRWELAGVATSMTLKGSILIYPMMFQFPMGISRSCYVVVVVAVGRHIY